jgi:hypothetical protein
MKKSLARTAPAQGSSLATSLIVVGAAFVLVAFVVYLRPEYRVNNEFTVTTCTILNKQLIVLQDRNGTVYRPEFHIRYRADGKVYEAHTYNITGETTSGRAPKEEILERYEIGQSYPCWYDPLHPQTAVLVRGYSMFGFLLAAFGVLVMLIGAVGLM